MSLVLPMNHSSQIRMTNDEIRRNDQIRMTKPATAQLRGFGHSGFGFLSSLVVRPSSFNDSSLRPDAAIRMAAATEDGCVLLRLPDRMPPLSYKQPSSSG